MTIILRSDAAMPDSLRRTAKLNAPVPSGLTGAFLMGTDALTSAHNYAPGMPDGTVIGLPTFGANYADMTGNSVAYIQTAITHTEDLTFIAVARPLADTSADVVGNYQSPSSIHAGATNGAHLYFESLTAADAKMSANFGQAWTNGTTSSGAIASTASPGQPIATDYLLSGYVNNAARVRTVNNVTLGLTGTNTPAASAADIGGMYRIGSAYNTQFTGQVRIYSVFIWSRMLSVSELASMYAWLRSYHSGLSI